MNNMFKISGFSDEIDSNVETQFTHLNKLGISYFEPRGINGKNISELDSGEVSRLKEIMGQYGIRVSSIGSPIGKIKITDDFGQHMELLKRVIQTAQMLEAHFIRVFSFFVPQGKAPDYREEVLDRVGQMVTLAEREGVVLLHENEKDIYGDVAVRCWDLFQNIQSPAFGCVFDPANFIQCGQSTYPDAFDRLEPYIRYLHIKDAKPDGTVVPSGYGEGHVKEIIERLAAKEEFRQDGLFLSLEPHLGNFAGLADLELDDHMLELEESGPDKFTMAFEALQNILKDIK